MYHLGVELHSQGGIVTLFELSPRESIQQTALAHPWGAYDDHLERLILFLLHSDCNYKFSVDRHPIII